MTFPYTGDVEVGGPAQVRELPGLTISKLAVSEMANNAYLLRDPATGEALLIDAADDPGALRGLIGDADLRTIVTTHGHWDHHRALPEIAQTTGAATVAHPADADDLPVPVQRTVEHGDTVTVGAQTLEVIHLRGHTPGSIALVWRGPDDLGEGAVVVPVPVRGDDGAQVGVSDQRAQGVRVGGRVDEQRLPAGGVAQQVGVVGHVAHRDLADRQAGQLAHLRRATDLDVAGVGRGHPGLRSETVGDRRYGPLHGR